MMVETCLPRSDTLPPVITTSQLDRLGERLRKDDAPPPSLLAELQRFRATHVAPLQAVVGKLQALGLEPTSRIKTVNTIIEKLRREKTRLSKMQDIGGVRIVVSGSIADQTQIAEEVIGLFPGAKLIDRRVQPNHGYRALHIIAPIDSVFIEVQLRTSLQDAWAQAMEKVSDLFGRGLRYGEQPTSPRSGPLVEALGELSDTIARFEEAASSSAVAISDTLHAQIHDGLKRLNGLLTQLELS